MSRAVTWWRHQVETFPRYWSFVWGIHWSPVNSPHKGQWRGALMFSLICAWTNGWVNNRGAVDLRRHRADYDVAVKHILEFTSSFELLSISFCCVFVRWICIFLFLWRKYSFHHWSVIPLNNFQRIYAISGRQLKRIESVKRSPVFASYSETLSGLRSIRAYHQQDRFIENADWLLDNSVKSYFLVTTSNRYGLWIVKPDFHDNVIKWKHFPRYWPFVRGIRRSPVNSPHKGQWPRALLFSLICTWKKRLSKQSTRRCFETLSRSLWRHCNVMMR